MNTVYCSEKGFEVLTMVWLLTLSTRKTWQRCVCGFLELFPIQNFFSIFNFSDLLIWTKIRKDVSKPLPSNSTTCRLRHCCFFGSFWSIYVQYCVWGSWNSVNRNRQLEVFCLFIVMIFLRLMFFWSIFEHICKKFSPSFSSFSLNVSLLSFSFYLSGSQI